MDSSDDELPELISVPKVKSSQEDSSIQSIEESNENVAVINTTDDQQVPDLNNNEVGNGEVQVGVDSSTKNKKKKKKKKKKKNLNEEEGEAIHGDIDFHDIGPVEENADSLYDLSRPLTHRIEIAVQNYKKNRKFTAVRNQVFTSYMRFGGVATGPKQFLGQNEPDDDMDAQDIAAHRATEYIDEDAIEDMEVDFTYTATVYLSSYIIDKSGYVKIDQFREGPEVVISFINYLLNHKVCPEYDKDMRCALEIAQRARIELPNCKFLAQSMPGKFNKACSLLFGGEFYGMLDNCWGSYDQAVNMIGISKAEASDIFEQVTGLKHDKVQQEKTASKIAVTLNITATGSSPESQSPGTTPLLVESQASQPHARLILCERDNEDASPITILLSQNEAQYAMQNMIITADLHKLSNGIWYWDRVTNVYPSYYKEAEDDSDDEE